MLENGVKITIVSNTGEAQKFYIGDVTYVMNDEVNKIWAEKDYEDGETKVPAELTSAKKETSFACYGTKWGDGCYNGQCTNFDYGVDGGVIGVIPADICTDEEYSVKCMNSVVAKKVEMYVDDKCNFEFYVDGKLFDYIATDDEELEDDEYDEEYEEEEEYDEEYDEDSDEE